MPKDKTVIILASQWYHLILLFKKTKTIICKCFKECKYIDKNVIRRITEDLENCSHDSDYSVEE